jgi:hypothetical protein
VKPAVPAHEPSVETLPAAAEATGALAEVAALVLVAATPLAPQLPKPDWQPVPQYAEVEPQYPAGLQQFPNEDPKQVYPLAPPQVASGVTVLAPVAVGAAAEVAGLAAPAPPAVRYQFTAGSPRQSPTVTALYPSWVRVESMYSVKFQAVCSWMS